jgi:chlorobactene glucosyltransferase
VIVVDDRSEDRTSDIVEEIKVGHPTLRVVQGQELPEGWVGKPFALHQGVERARGEWFCFLDADTFPEPELLISAYLKAEKLNADCLTLFTKQIMGGFWEKVVLPIVFSAMMFGFPPHKVNDPDHPLAIANGQFILIRRDVYQAVGGLYQVRSRIDEDKALAEEVKRQGFRLLLADGQALAKTRMYSSLSELWEGWTKNMFLGMQDRLGLLAIGGIIALLGALGIPLWWGVLLANLSLLGWLPSAFMLAELIVFSIYLGLKRAQVARGFDLSPWYGLSLPLGSGIFAGMVIASIFYVLSGHGVTWKKRRYL